jgi:hypothetical protein
VEEAEVNPWYCVEKQQQQEILCTAACSEKYGQEAKKRYSERYAGKGSNAALEGLYCTRRRDASARRSPMTGTWRHSLTRKPPEGLTDTTYVGFLDVEQKRYPKPHDNNSNASQYMEPT